MKKESKNRFCFKKARWILAAAAALSLYPGSVFAEENIEVENTAAELSVEESATPVPEKTETTEISEPQLQEQPTKKEPAETTETTEVTEEKKVQNFRSALELLKLISGALDEGDIEAEGGNHEK